ncbi:MAG TPA: hypothetical protein VGA56_25810 [Opitutaceae bacterium]
MRNLRFDTPLTGSSILHALRAAGRHFRPGAATGILPINFNRDREGRVVKGQFLCLGRQEDRVWDLLDEARQVLPVLGDADRD